MNYHLSSSSLASLNFPKYCKVIDKLSAAITVAKESHPCNVHKVNNMAQRRNNQNMQSLITLTKPG